MKSILPLQQKTTNFLNKTMNIAHYKKILLVFICIGFSLSSVFSQTPAIDHLNGTLNRHTQTDTAKVNLLNKLAYELFTYDVKQTKTYAEQSLTMAVQLNYPKGKATALWLVGMSCSTSDPQLSLTYYEQALKIAKQINDQAGISTYLMGIGIANKTLGNMEESNKAYDKALQIATALKDQPQQSKLLYNISLNRSSMGQYPEAVENLQKMIDMASKADEKPMLLKGYSSMATIYQRQGNSVQALESYLSALEISEQLDKKQSIVHILINIAGVQSDLNENKTALETLHQAQQLAKEMGDSAMISNCLTNIGNVYKKMKHPEALQHLQAALRMVGENNISQRINLLMNIGSVYAEKKQFDKAEKNLNEALKLAQQARVKYASSEVLQLLGNLYYTQKDYKHAIECAKSSLEISSEINYLEVKKDNYKLLSDIYAATGNYKEAYQSHALHKQLNDSVFNDKNIRKIALMESAYKHDKEKQKYEMEKITQLLKIKNQRYFILFLAIVIVLVIILSYQFYLSNRLKKKALRLEIDQINNQLEYSHKELASATLKLVQSSESDAYCMKILKDIGSNTNEEGGKDVHSLINYYQNKSVYTNWEEFETLFLKVNSDFYEKLNEHFPTLTLNERKLCVFLKLNMSNKDIAQITFQSDEALKKARMRLRKKFQMDRDENLISFIQNL